jgi:hypothetical protein
MKNLKFLSIQIIYRVITKKFIYTCILIFISGYIGRYCVLYFNNTDVLENINNWKSIGFFTIFSIWCATIKEAMSIIFDSATIKVGVDNTQIFNINGNDKIIAHKMDIKDILNTPSPSPSPNTGESSNQASSNQVNNQGGINQVNHTNQQNNVALYGARPPIHNPSLPITPVDDPTNIATRGYDPSQTNQPLARNIAAAIENTPNRGLGTPNLSQDVSNWFTSFLNVRHPRVIHGGPNNNTNYYPGTKTIIKDLKKLP